MSTPQHGEGRRRSIGRHDRRRHRVLGVAACLAIAASGTTACSDPPSGRRATPAAEARATTSASGSERVGDVARPATAASGIAGPDHVAISLLSQDPGWHPTRTVVDRRSPGRATRSAPVVWSLDQSSGEADAPGGDVTSTLSMRVPGERGPVCRTATLAPAAGGQMLRVLVAAPTTVPASQLGGGIPAAGLPVGGDLPPVTVTSTKVTPSDDRLSIRVTGRVHITSDWLAERFNLPFLPSFSEDVLFDGTVPLRLRPAASSDVTHAIVVSPDAAQTTVQLRLDNVPRAISNVLVRLGKNTFRRLLTNGVVVIAQQRIDATISERSEVAWFRSLGYALSMRRVDLSAAGLSLLPAFCRPDGQLPTAPSDTPGRRWALSLDLLDPEGGGLSAPLTVARSWVERAPRSPAGRGTVRWRGEMPDRSAVTFAASRPPPGASVAVRIREHDRSLACRTLPVALAPEGDAVHLLVAPPTAVSSAEIADLAAPLAGTVVRGDVSGIKTTVRLGRADLVPRAGALRLTLGGTLRVQPPGTVWRFDFTYTVDMRVLPDTGPDPTRVLGVATTGSGRLQLRWRGRPPSGGEPIRANVKTKAEPTMRAQVESQASTMVGDAVRIPEVTWWTDQGFSLTMRHVRTQPTGLRLDGALCRLG